MATLIRFSKVNTTDTGQAIINLVSERIKNFVWSTSSGTIMVKVNRIHNKPKNIWLGNNVEKITIRGSYYKLDLPTEVKIGNIKQPVDPFEQLIIYRDNGTPFIISQNRDLESTTKHWVVTKLDRSSEITDNGAAVIVNFRLEIEEVT